MGMELIDILMKQKKHKASDVHLCVGAPPKLRLHGNLVSITEEKLTPADLNKYLREMLTDEQMEKFEATKELDLAYTTPETGRYRVNCFKQKDFSSVVMRSIATKIPSAEELGLPESITNLARKKRGLILVTGPTGSGKSTTLASLIDIMNSSRADNIITIEDPIEYLHKHKASLVTQRELGRDTFSFANAIRAALREDPDIILVGEMRDPETIETAITAAETGHLVLSTLHTIGAASSIDRIVGVFEPHQQQQIRMQLGNILEAVISQQLIPTVDKKGRVAAFEIMLSTPAINNLIREGKIFQIDSTISTSSSKGMCLMDDSIASLYFDKKISKQSAIDFCVDYPTFRQKIGK